jgi:D-alanine--D-alanine ligase
MSTPRIALFFGGPSNERDISLDSARSFYDAIRFAFDPKAIELYFVDKNCRIHLLDPKWIYCNAIEDFEAVVIGKKASINSDSESVWKKNRWSSHVICPLIHGSFGEDGVITRKFEELGCGAILGSASDVLALCIDKAKTLAAIKKMGFSVPRGTTVDYSQVRGRIAGIARILRSQFGSALPRKFIVKPNDCGSSDGVSLCELASMRTALAKAARFSKTIRVEEMVGGKEFSIIVIECGGTYLPLIPTGIRFARESESVYSRQKKYMPGSGASHEIPISLSFTKIREIQKQASRITETLHVRDWCRLDGFVTGSGKIVWLEINPVPGCGQDSFLFQQTTAVGVQPAAFCFTLLNAVARRGGLPLKKVQNGKARKLSAVAVIGGGASSERHVSRMSWLNVCRKLADSKTYKVSHIFLNTAGRFFELPAFFTLQHTVDEIEELLNDDNRLARLRKLTRELKARFPLESEMFGLHEIKSPKQIDLESISRANDFAFLALHGGVGEDGTLQAKLEALGLAFNGSSSSVSNLCMDKHRTAELIKAAHIEGVAVPKQAVFHLDFVKEQCLRMGENVSSFLGKAERWDWFSTSQSLLNNGCRPFARAVLTAWDELRRDCGMDGTVVAKPKGDGCSSGVVVFRESKKQLPLYALCLFAGVKELPFHLFFPKSDNTEKLLKLPSSTQREFLIEEYIGPKTSHENGRYVEITAGVVEYEGRLRCLTPSEVKNDCGVLTVDEKFNKGVGVNLTPPPGIPKRMLESIAKRIEKVARILGVQNYARIDAIVDVRSNLVYILECNTLPGLTAATVLYTQALHTKWLSAPPFEFLNYLIQNPSKNLSQNSSQHLQLNGRSLLPVASAGEIRCASPSVRVRSKFP